MTIREIPYSIVDVFTTTPFLGNPLAVIKDATGLSSEEMLLIAREFGFAETSFILPPRHEDNSTTSFDARVRIFMPSEEVPFAGHPNIGTAFVIGTETTVAGKKPSSKQLVFDELGGAVDVELLLNEGGDTIGASITAPHALEIVGKCDPKLIAQCLTLPLEKIGLDRIEPCVASVGLRFAFVEITDLEALAAIKLDTPAFEEAKTQGPITCDGFAISPFVVLSETENEINLRVRSLCPFATPIEDPACGSGSAALAALLTPKNCGKGGYQVNIDHGVEMGRSSQIKVHMLSPTTCPKISGHCVTISNGIIKL
jgi:trans-2,3-dihydro-3-hydroxyanthranilate isomerase